MKKYKYHTYFRNFMYLLAFLSVVSISVRADTVKAASINQKIGGAYAKIVRQYMDIVDECRKDTRTRTDDERAALRKKYPNAGHLLCKSTGTLGLEEGIIARFRVCYRISDLNGDKIPELIVGSLPLTPINADNNKYFLFGVYSYDQSKGVTTISDFIGMRCGMVLCKNGVILCEGGSGAAFDTFRYYKVGKNGKCICLEAVRFSWDPKSIKYYKGKSSKDYFNLNLHSTSRQQYIKIQKKYCQPLKNPNLRFYRADHKALSALRKGRISYKGQKSFKKKVPTPDSSYLYAL